LLLLLLLLSLKLLLLKLLLLVLKLLLLLLLTLLLLKVLFLFIEVFSNRFAICCRAFCFCRLFTAADRKSSIPDNPEDAWFIISNVDVDVDDDCLWGGFRFGISDVDICRDSIYFVSFDIIPVLGLPLGIADVDACFIIEELSVNASGLPVSPPRCRADCDDDEYLFPIPIPIPPLPIPPPMMDSLECIGFAIGIL